jgi:DNA-binding LacI/PurR family transcriptional regulator
MHMRINVQREQSYQTIRRWIEDGVFPRGTQFPAERDLAKKLGVSLSSVHRAVVDLEREKLVAKKSPRIRIVTEGKASEPAPIDGPKNTVIIVSPKYRETAPMYFKRPGWAYYNYIAILVTMQNQGYNTLLVPPDRFEAEIDGYVRNRPFGVIFTENGGVPPLPETLLRLRKAAVPFVAYGDYPEMDCVRCNHRAGTYELAQFLISRGRRRIQMLIPEEHKDDYWVSQRLDGLRKAVAEAGLEFVPPLFEMPFQDIPGRTELESFEARSRFSAGCLARSLLAPSPPDALMLLSDWSVAQAGEACEILGKRPNVDVDIAGYDCFYDETPDYALKPLAPVATLDKLLAESGQKMAEILFARAAGTLPPEPCKVTIEPKLIIVE